MQSYNNIPDTFTLQESRLLLLNNILTSLSSSSGTAFPTADLYVGMPCFRTDLNAIYILTALTPTWELLFDFDNTATSQEYVDANTLSSSGDVSTGNQRIQKATPEFILQRTDDGTTITIRFREADGTTRGHVQLAPNGSFSISRNSATGAVQTTFSLSADGNVSVNGSAPTTTSHLTRRDYVNAQDALRLALTGGSVTGQIKGITPVANEDLTRKDYVDTTVATAIATAVAKRSTNISVTVGAAGDYTTITAALEYLSSLSPLVHAAASPVTATVSLLAGFVMAEQVRIRSNLGWVTITSVSAEVTITRSALTITDDVGVAGAFIGERGATLPTINTLFNFDASGTTTNKAGISLSGGSIGRIAINKGFSGFGAGSVTYGAYVADGAFLSARQGALHGHTYGIYATTAAKVSAPDLSASYGGTGIYALDGAIVEADSANLNNNSSYGVYATKGGKVVTIATSVNGCNRGFYASFGAIIIANDAIAAVGTPITITPVEAVHAEILVEAAILYSTNGVNAYSGAKINARSATIGNASGTTFNVYNGSVIVSNTAGGVPTFNQTVNTLTSGGIIYN